MGHFRVVLIDQNDKAALVQAFEDKPKLVLIETPSNPLMRIVDIRAIVARARAVGAKVAVDNTFLSPALQRPITLGADFVIHSTTKYLNGHSDVVGGAVIAADAGDIEALADWANIVGTTGAPFDCYLTLRGIRTLFPRMERQQRSAQAIAEFLAEHPLVAACHYPGLPAHPGHVVARAQQSGFGAMLSFELRGGGAEAGRFVEAMRTFSLAELLGGIESLVAHPATMTHSGIPEEVREAAGITSSLIRLSVGLEAEADLIADLERALATIGCGRETGSYLIGSVHRGTEERTNRRSSEPLAGAKSGIERRNRPRNRTRRIPGHSRSGGLLDFRRRRLLIGAIGVHHPCREDESRSRINGYRYTKRLCDLLAGSAVSDRSVDMHRDTPVAPDRDCYGKSNEFSHLCAQQISLLACRAERGVAPHRLGAELSDLADAGQHLLTITFPIEHHAILLLLFQSVSRHQDPMAKRWRLCAGGSTSSTIAIAKSLIEI